MEEGAPAEGTWEGGEPPGGSSVAGAIGIDVEGDEDAWGLGEAGDPLQAAGAGGGTGGDGGDEIAGGLDDGEGVEFAFDEDGGEGSGGVGAQGPGVVGCWRSPAGRGTRVCRGRFARGSRAGGC